MFALGLEQFRCKVSDVCSCAILIRFDDVYVLRILILGNIFWGVRKVERFGDQVIAVEEKTFGAGRPANLPDGAGEENQRSIARNRSSKRFVGIDRRRPECERIDTYSKVGYAKLLRSQDSGCSYGSAQ